MALNRKGMVHGSSAYFIFLRCRELISCDLDPCLAGWWVRASFHIRSPARRPSMGVIKTNCQCFLRLSQTNGSTLVLPGTLSAVGATTRGDSWASDREDMADCRIHMRQHTVCLLKCSDRSCVFTLRYVCSALWFNINLFSHTLQEIPGVSFGVEGGRLKSSNLPEPLHQVQLAGWQIDNIAGM